jgi:hypothetical protein
MQRLHVCHTFPSPYSHSSPVPRFNADAEPLIMPLRGPPTVALREADSFSAAPRFVPADGRLLSDVPSDMTLAVGLPPRVIDPQLLAGAQQVRLWRQFFESLVCLHKALLIVVMLAEKSWRLQISCWPRRAGGCRTYACKAVAMLITY